MTHDTTYAATTRAIYSAGLIEKTVVLVSEIATEEDCGYNTCAGLSDAELAHEISCYGELSVPGLEAFLFTEHLRFDVECLDSHGSWSTMLTQEEIALQTSGFTSTKLRYDEHGWKWVCRDIAETLGRSPANIVSITAILDPDHWSLNPL